MTVAELIEQLLKLKPDARVIVNGYEAGYEDVKGVEYRDIRLNVNDNWYEGPHEEPDEEHPTFDECAVYIGAPRDYSRGLKQRGD